MSEELIHRGIERKMKELGFAPGYHAYAEFGEGPQIRDFTAPASPYNTFEAEWTVAPDVMVTVRATVTLDNDPEQIVMDAVRTVAQKLGIDVEPKAAPDSGAVRPDDV